MLFRSAATTSLEVPHIPIAASLGFIIAVLAITAAASLIAVRRHPELVAEGPEAKAELEAQADYGQALEDIEQAEQAREADPPESS